MRNKISPKLSEILPTRLICVHQTTKWLNLLQRDNKRHRAVSLRQHGFLVFLYLRKSCVQYRPATC